MITPLVILDVQGENVSDPHQTQVLVQWSGLAPEDSTWENLAQLLQDFPNIHLEDKVFVMGNGDDSMCMGEAQRETEYQSGAEELEPTNPQTADVNERPKRESRRPSYLDEYVHG